MENPKRFGKRMGPSVTKAWILSHLYIGSYKMGSMIKKSLFLLPFALLYAGLPVPEQMRADFNQTVRNVDSNETLRYGGHFALKVPDRAKWVYERPMRKIICLDHDRAWVVEPELEQATIYRLDKAIPLVAILKNAKKVGERRYETRYEGTTYRLTVDEKMRPLTLSYDDELGNRVTMRFFRFDTGPIPEKVLECSIPKEYDVIDGRF